MPDAPNSGSNRKSQPAGLGNQVRALLPTPRVSSSNGTSEAELAAGNPYKRLETEVELFPTPNAYDGSKGGSQHPAKRRGGGHQPSVADVVEHLLPSPRAVDHSATMGAPAANRHVEAGNGSLAEKSTHLATRLHYTDFGHYTPAIERWEAVLGREAPAPTEPTAKGKQRLSAAFVEWLMGQSQGWVTDPDLSLSRAQQLRCLGNGVVTQQAVYALNWLIHRADHTTRRAA